MRRYYFLSLISCFSLFGESRFDPRELYIDLVKKCVANTIYEDQSSIVYKGRTIKKNVPYNTRTREYGWDWPSLAHTMIGMKRLDNIHACAKAVLEEGIPGDFIETGVWRGGAVILMRAILKAYNDTEKRVFVADSFEGLPKPNTLKYPQDQGLDLWRFDELAVPLEEVQSNFTKYALLDDQVIFLKGFFSETLPTAPIESLSLLRLDGDLYESTMDALTHLYPKLSVGGYVIIDDYCIPQCKAAVTDYRARQDIIEKIIPIDRNGVYWKKERKCAT